MSMDRALQTYIEESHGLLEEMESILLRLESEPQDDETVNAMFRAAHTIKGSAGLFGLDAIVVFTHVVENVLEAVRDGTLAVSGELVELLLECRDHIGLLITVVAESGAALDAEQSVAGEALVARLRAFMGGRRWVTPACRPYTKTRWPRAAAARSRATTGTCRSPSGATS